MRGSARVRRGASGAVAFASAVFLVTALPRAAQPAAGVGVLDVELAPTEITVGDRIEARLTLVWNGPEPVVEPRFPTWRENWGDAEVLSAADVEVAIEADNRRVYRQTLVLTAFTLGEITLPEITVGVPLDGETVEITTGRNPAFAVRSVLSEGQLEPRPPAPPRSLAATTRFAWTTSGLGTFSLLMIWLLGRRIQTPPVGAPSLPAEPLAELLSRLQRLDPAAAESSHTGLSLGLRDFLGQSLNFPAAESTTSEIERHLHQTRLAPEATGSDDALVPLWRSTVDLLRDCDQVKFARLPVPPQVTRGRLRAARDLGHRIDSGLKPAVQADEGLTR